MITLRHTTLGRTPLDRWSARRTDNTQQSRETDIHASGEIRTHNPRKRKEADPRLRLGSATWTTQQIKFCSGRCTHADALWNITPLVLDYQKLHFQNDVHRPNKSGQWSHLSQGTCTEMRKLNSTELKYRKYDSVRFIRLLWSTTLLGPVDVSRSHIIKTKTPTRTPLNEWSARRRGRYLQDTQQTQNTNIHAFSWIRTRDPSNPGAADILIRRKSHGDRHVTYNKGHPITGHQGPEGE